MMRQPNPGDIQFTFHPGGILSEAIAHKTHAKISHAQMIVDVGANDAIQVVSADAQGLVYKWLRPEQFGYEDWHKTKPLPIINHPWQNILFDTRLDQIDRDVLVNWMIKKCDSKVPYDIWGLMSFVVGIDLNNEKRVFCSEVCFQAYEENFLVPPLDGVDHAFVSPRDLYISCVLQPIQYNDKEIR